MDGDIKEEENEILFPVIFDRLYTRSDITEENSRRQHESLRDHGDLVTGICTGLL
jgi:hypothetical protein